MNSRKILQSGKPEHVKNLFRPGNCRATKKRLTKSKFPVILAKDYLLKDMLKNDEIQGNKEPLHEAYAAIRRESGNEVDTGKVAFFSRSLK